MKRNRISAHWAALKVSLQSIQFSMWLFIVALGIAAIGILLLGPASIGSRNLLRSIEPGKVAEADIYAGKDTVYIDKEATQRKIQAEERLVPAVFVIDDNLTTLVREQTEEFSSYYLRASWRPSLVSLEALALMLSSRFPDLLEPDEYRAVLQARLNAQAFVYLGDIVESMLSKGIVSVPDGVFERFNPDYFELVRTIDGRQQSEQRAVSSMITMSTLRQRIEDEMDARQVPQSQKYYIRLLAQAILKENTFFDQGLSEKRLAAARLRVEPVTRFVSRE